MRAGLRGACAAGAVVLGTALLGCGTPAALSGLLPCGPTSLMGESGRWSALSPERADSEFAEVKREFDRSGSECDRFRLALLSFHSPSRRHDAYAAKLMEDYLEAKSSRSAPLVSLARVLLRAFRDRADADAQLRAAGRRLAEEQARGDALRRQLDEMMNIEKILKEREKR